MRNLTRREFLELTGLGSGVVLATLAGCTPQATATGVATSIPATPTTAAPKVLRARLYGDIQNLDPPFKKGGDNETVIQTIYNGLVRYGPNSYDVINDLADSIQTSADGKEITFKLKEGVKWQKGYGEVTTEDIKFSYERYIDQNNLPPYADDWATLDHVEIIDTYNGKIVLKEPFAPLFHSTLPVSSGLVVCKKYVEEVGLEKFATNALGSGPYVFSEWEPKQKIIMRRNPDYFGTQPYYDEIHFFPIEDDKAAEVALEAGELDWSRISLTSFERFANNPNFKTLKLPALRYGWIGMNMEHPKLQDINVRQAIRYGIDVPSILQAAYMGQADQEYALIAPGLIGYWKDAPHYQRDVVKAKEFMAKAGLESLDLRFDCQNVTEYRTWAEITQQNLKEIGINITINPMDTASFWSLGEGEAGKNAELFSIDYSMEPDPSWATMWFLTSQVGIWNWMRWSSKEFDDLHAQGMTTLDNTERNKIYIKMQQLWDEACHTVWVTHGSLTYAYVPSLKPATTPNGDYQARFFTAG